MGPRVLPEHHLGSETRDTVRLAIGTVTTMTALVLGLATTSAKNTFDLTCRNVLDSSVDLITIDRMLRRYGDEAAGVEVQLARLAESALRARWALATEQHARMPLFFLVAIGSRLMVTFFRYGLFAQRNTVVFLTLSLCSLSVSSAIFLILEMERPFSGFVRIRPEGIRHVESVLGK